ncbi:hypothetical protein GQ42DRAFT_160784 [Ramicandelaber brevisporus]|nr:hypothetical protein GQ42DRAFT_160784 [Ramicandelaber brevisporus]
MKLLVLLLVTLVALFGVVLATKEDDYLAYKNAEKAADSKKAACSKYAAGSCGTIAECDTCATCLTEVTSLYKTAVAMRREYTRKWFAGVSDPGHTAWERGLTSANNSRVQMANKCKGTKKILVAKEKREAAKSPTVARRASVGSA